MWAIELILLIISNNYFKQTPNGMVSSLIFQKLSEEGLTKPSPQNPSPVFSRTSPSVWVSPSILKRFVPSTCASPSIELRGANSQISWGGEIFFGVGEIFFCAVVSKAPYQHPLLKAIHVLKCNKV